ncbi:hypothetical protein GH714_032997 [Hevea brasiliensis]|uniref:Uncharacterized protein n=1 Tax=Hevea brasiliensis TaxID=3981 RepID=A0A6A6L739_HEVBR|nr:hypothetical protein GH714_032997 [Hevea brasiliensis]
MPKETLNLQGSSGSVMESGIQSITLGVFSPTPEAINTDAWTKDEDEQNFEEKISRSLKHFNSQSDGFFGEKGKEIINSDSNGVTSENSLPMPKETLNLQGSSGSVMESGIQIITLGVFSPTPEAINTDA